MGMLPAEFFTAHTGYALVYLTVVLTISASFAAWLTTPSTHYAKIRQQQRLVDLYAYAARLQAATRPEPASLVTQLDSSPGEVQSTSPGELASVPGDCPLCHRLTVEEPRFGGNHRCIYCGWIEDLT